MAESSAPLFGRFWQRWSFLENATTCRLFYICNSVANFEYFMTICYSALCFENRILFVYLWFWRTKIVKPFIPWSWQKNYQYFIRKTASSIKMIFFQFENTDFHSFWQKLRFALNSQGWQHWLFYKNLCYCSIFFIYSAADI